MGTRDFRFSFLPKFLVVQHQQLLTSAGCALLPQLRLLRRSTAANASRISTPQMAWARLWLPSRLDSSPASRARRRPPSSCRLERDETSDEDEACRAPVVTLQVQLPHTRSSTSSTTQGREPAQREKIPTARTAAPRRDAPSSRTAAQHGDDGRGRRQPSRRRPDWYLVSGLKHRLSILSDFQCGQSFRRARGDRTLRPKNAPARRPRCERAVEPRLDAGRERSPCAPVTKKPRARLSEDKATCLRPPSSHGAREPSKAERKPTTFF